jgi:2,3-bisphosphoglycerate-dependent phosphoglycerate mutase
MTTDISTSHYITFLRHGKSQANEEGVLQGQIDSPLAVEGIQQSQALGEYWANEGIDFKKIICSPLGRAHQTALIVTEYLSSQIELDDHWKEREFGSAEGLPYDEIFSKYNDLPPRSVYEPAYETGESDWDLFIRAAMAVQNLTYLPADRYLVVSHGAILNAALSAIIGITPRPTNHRIRFRFNNTGYAHLEYNAVRQIWRIHSLNNICHLINLKQKDDNPSE